jgi:hypothetical protein
MIANATGLHLRGVIINTYQRSSAMIKRLFIAAGIGLALSGTAFAQGAGKTGPSAAGSSNDATANAIAQCDALTGAQKSSCLDQVRQSLDRSATGSTSGSASGRAGAGASMSQPKDSAPSSGAPKGY